MECGRDLIASFLDSFSGWTVDLGVEAGMPHFLSETPDSVLPYWWSHSAPTLEPDVENYGDAAPPVVPADPCPFPGHSWMKRALIVAGMCHVCSNMADEVHNRMQFWPTFYPQLKHIEALLVQRERRDFFFHRCINNTAYGTDTAKLLFEREIPRLYDNRGHGPFCF